jgi:hypothetical protein
MKKSDFIKEFSAKYNYKLHDVEYWLNMIVKSIRDSKIGLTKEQIYDKTRFFNAQSRYDFLAYAINDCKIVIKKMRLDGSRKATTLYRYKN